MYGRGADLILNRRRSWILLTPAVLIVCFVVVLPVLYMLWISFKPSSNHGAYGAGYTVMNYVSLVTNEFYRTVIVRTLVVGVSVSLICLIVGYPVAFHLSRLPAKKQRLFLLLIVAPLYTSIVIRAYAWMVILGRKGIINEALTSFLPIDPIPFMNSPAGVIIGLVYVFLAFMILSIYNVLVSVPAHFEEAALNLGASKFRTFREVTLPLSVPGILAGCILVFVLSMGAFVIPAVLGGPKMSLVPNYIYSSVLNTFNWPLGAAFAFIFLAITGAALYAYSWLTKTKMVVGGGA